MTGLVWTLGWLWAATAAWASPEPAAYQVGPRDVLHVEVFGEADISGDLVVSESGTVTLRYLGEVHVQGDTLEQVTDRIHGLYKQGILIDPEVSVTIREYKSQPYQVVGAVKEPGIFFIERPITVREALGLAGWIDTEKSSRQVAVRRASGDPLVFSMEQLGGQLGDTLVQVGDVISVEEGQWVFVSGEVEKAGAIVYYDGLSVWNAVTLAGGPAETARLRRAHLVRADGERVEVNLKRIRDGKEPDVAMKPGDRLSVYESPL